MLQKGWTSKTIAMVMKEKKSSSENNGRSEAIFDPLKTVLSREIPEFVELLSLDRLSGGASQETYCIELLTQDGTLRLAMRRASGGEQREISAQYPGLATEAVSYTHLTLPTKRIV